MLGLMLERMGITSQASSISHITEGVTFIGSSFGDSQLVQLSPSPAENRGHVREIERWNNSAQVTHCTSHSQPSRANVVAAVWHVQ